MKKLNDLGSPRPNEGEGLRGEGGGTCRIESRGEAEEALQMRKDKRTLSQYGNPPHPPAPLPVGARGAAIELDFNFFTPSLHKGESFIFIAHDAERHRAYSFPLGFFNSAGQFVMALNPSEAWLGNSLIRTKPLPSGVGRYPQPPNH